MCRKDTKDVAVLVPGTMVEEQGLDTMGKKASGLQEPMEGWDRYCLSHHHHRKRMRSGDSSKMHLERGIQKGETMSGWIEF